MICFDSWKPENEINIIKNLLTEIKPLPCSNLLVLFHCLKKLKAESKINTIKLLNGIFQKTVEAKRFAYLTGLENMENDVSPKDRMNKLIGSLFSLIWADMDTLNKPEMCNSLNLIAIFKGEIGPIWFF